MAKKKAICPIVASLLLIAVTVAAGTLAYAGITHVMGAARAGTEGPAIHRLTLLAYDFRNVSAVNLLVKNVGRANVTVASATFAGVPVAGFTAVRIAPYEEVLIRITLPFSVTRGVSYAVTLITADGAKFGFTVIAGRGSVITAPTPTPAPAEPRLQLLEYDFTNPAELRARVQNTGQRELEIIEMTLGRSEKISWPFSRRLLPGEEFRFVAIIAGIRLTPGIEYKLTFRTVDGLRFEFAVTVGSTNIRPNLRLIDYDFTNLRVLSVRVRNDGPLSIRIERLTLDGRELRIRSPIPMRGGAERSFRWSGREELAPRGAVLTLVFHTDRGDFSFTVVAGEKRLTPRQLKLVEYDFTNLHVLSVRVRNVGSVNVELVRALLGGRTFWLFRRIPVGGEALITLRRVYAPQGAVLTLVLVTRERQTFNFTVVAGERQVAPRRITLIGYNFLDLSRLGLHLRNDGGVDVELRRIYINGFRESVRIRIASGEEIATAVRVSPPATRGVTYTVVIETTEGLRFSFTVVAGRRVG